MGNRPKATKLKILQNNPGRRPLNSNEPEPIQGIPEMPEWLSTYPVAVKEWERESKILNDMGIMSTAEGGLLAMRVYLASQIQRIAREIEKGELIAYTQIKNLISEYRQHGSLLGLDASSRSKMPVKTKPRSKAQKFMDRKNGGAQFD